MTGTHILYAVPHSLFAGKVRSYLIKNEIRFRELSTGHESFKADVLPKSKLPTVPTLVTVTGEVIRDGAAIIEHFEAANGRPCQPGKPRQQILSALLDLIGVEGLWRPSMHYRWGFPDENLEFLRYHFFHSQRETPERGEKTEYMMGKMQNAAEELGVNDQSVGTVESLYLEFIEALNAHFVTFPYLLGWRPCIGDFGLMAPMYAHLGRDPYPAQLMQRRAVRVFRWVERMNRFDQDASEYFDAGNDYLPNDEVPGTLLAVLRTLAEDFVPETHAAWAFINDWLAKNQPATGAVAERRLGTFEFSVRGVTLTTAAHPYRFFLLQRVHTIYESLDATARSQVEAMLTECGMAELLELGLDRQLCRADNLEVWN